MDRDIAAWLETQAELHHTAPSTTIVPSRPGGINIAISVLEQMKGTSLLASVQLKPGPVIGQGGMGVVREAEQVALNRIVAIKTLKADKRNPEAAQDLLREAWVTGSLEHPNVVPVHHLGLDDDGMPAIVLKRVEGVEWSKLIRDPGEVKRRYAATDQLAWNLAILMQVLNAIRFAHSRGIIHRDLKPSNVMIGDFGEVYLLDWGIAVSLVDDGSGRLPLAKDADTIAGTPCYMAPEMMARDGDVPLSERTDVYLAGAVLFEIVAGRPPHLGKNALEVMTSVLTSQPQVPDDAPGELGTIITRAMAQDPDKRFESAEAFRLALQSYLEHRGSDQLAAKARLRLDELAAVLARPVENRGDHREEVYRLFGACRFGFHEALAVWHENAAARNGLRRATIAVAEYELATGDAHSAVSLLSELDDAPALFEQAKAAAAQQADRRRALESLGYAHDLEVGRVERGKLASTLGAIFTVGPTLAGIFPALNPGTYWFMALWTGTFAAITAAWTWLDRKTLATTIVNRRLIGAMLFMLIAQGFLVACTWAAGMSVLQTQVLLPFLYFVIAGCVAMTVDRAILPTSLGFGAAFVLATKWPAHTLLFIGLANGVFMINSIVAWRLPKKK